MIIDLHQDLSVQLLSAGINDFLVSRLNNKLETYGRSKLVKQITLKSLINQDCRLIGAAACALNLNSKGIFVPPQPSKALGKHLEAYLELIGRSGGKLFLVKNNHDLKKLQADKVGLILAVEGLYCLERASNFRYLDRLYKIGVRIISPTWNLDNCFGGGGKSQKGLTATGVSLLEYLNHHGIIIDGSHLSKKSLKDALGYSKKPIIVSHALTKRYHKHFRNLDDTTIKKICRQGGLIGVCFVQTFSGKNGLDYLTNHIIHLLKIGSPDNIAIGSDFGAMFLSETISGLENVDRIKSLEKTLKKRGIGNRTIEKIKWKNAFNFMKDNL